MPHQGAPQPPPPWGWAIGRDDPVPEFALAAAGTLNCLSRVVPLHLGQWGTSLELRTRVSKAWSQGSHLNSYIGMGGVLILAVAFDSGPHDPVFSIVTAPPVNATREATPMKVRPLSREEVRGIDARALEDYRLPTIVLMENAGRGAAAWLLDKIERGRVVIACGSGNNGGDGGVVARHLDAWGFDVRIAWFADPARLKGDAAIQRDILERSEIPAQVIHEDAPSDQIDALWDGADWLVDALLGTGLTRPVEGLLALAIGSMNRSNRPILALDLPSGLDADTGEPLGNAIGAAATATFVAPKLGFSGEQARAYTGEVFVVDIGVPRALLSGLGTED